MLGLILCGGQSSRMNNNDKGLLVSNGKLWATIAYEKLSKLDIPVLISINNQQENKYKNEFNSNTLIIDNQSLSIKGPLLGILSTYFQNPNDDLFILACDMPLMDSNLLKELYFKHQQNNDFDVYIYTNNNEMEPLCGIYTANALRKIVQLFDENKLIKHSMKFTLSNLNVCTIELSASQKNSFKNFNFTTDLD